MWSDAVIRSTDLWVYGHFGPKTLQTQDILALVPKCLGHFGITITLYDEKSDYVNFIPFR